MSEESSLPRYRYAHPFTRWAIFAPVALFVWIIVGTFSAVDGLAPKIALLATAVIGVVLTVRWIRAGVVIHTDEITVRGYVWSRTIRRARITEVTARKWIRWTDRTGLERDTPLSIFWNERYPTPGMIAHNDRVVLEIAEWVADWPATAGSRADANRVVDA